MTETSHDIRTLNGLIATTIDSVDGYRTSAGDVDSTRLAELFTARASERSSIAEQLRAEVSKLGGNPEDDGTILAAGHRAFVNLKAAVTKRDDDAIIAEVERGEDHIKGKYEDALKDDKLAADTRALIQTAYGSVKEGHDQSRSQAPHDRLNDVATQGRHDMSIFSKIKDAIFGHKTAAPTPTTGDLSQGTPGGTTVAPAPTITAPVNVDVEQVLNDISKQKGNPDLNWKSSIVDLMKLLGMDSSLQNREALATELGYTGAKDGSAEMNIWLHKEVMRQLAANGGKVPANLTD